MKNYSLRHLFPRFTIITLIVTTSLSCKKFVEIPSPVNQIISETAFADDKTALATINGIYSKMMSSSQNICSSTLSLFAGMSADELTYFTTTTRDEFIINKITQTNNIVLEGQLWNPSYNLIYAANSCIEGASASTSISADVKNQVLGEAHFVRAFLYFSLINLFGEVPLITTTDYDANKDKPRIAADRIYGQVIEDLLKSSTLLKSEYVSAGRARPNKAAVQTLLAKVYLYQRDWENAIKMCDGIINDDRYILLRDLNTVFLSDSQEAIWQLAPVTPNLNTYVGNLILPASASATPTYLITEQLRNDFEENDQRKAAWIQSRVYRGQTLYYPYKYKIKTGATVTEFQMVFRLAEIYLIRAEARAHSGNLDGAAEDLNTIRDRAGLGKISSTVGAVSLLSAIQHERRIELFSEWGNRWFDLKRTGTVDEVLSAIKPTWTPTAAWYPIPYSQILINTALKQNEGY
jgi:tetratricopeptide (TPR) repeat protein